MPAFRGHNSLKGLIGGWINGEVSANEFFSVQDAIDFAVLAGFENVIIPAGMVVSRPFTIRSGIRVRAYGALLRKTDSHTTLVTMESNTQLSGLEIEGAGNKEYNSAGIGIRIKGAWNAAEGKIDYIDNVEINDCKARNMGAYGIYAEYARNINISGGKIEHIGYAGIGCMSVKEVHVRDMHIKEISPGTSLNTYGVFFSKRSNSNDLNQYPNSENCSVTNCIVEDAPMWEALDTHGGRGIDFVGNTIRNCKVGIAVVPIDDANNVSIYGPKNCLVHGNKIYGIATGAGIVVKGAGSGVNVVTDYAEGISVQGNTLVNCGQQEADVSGGIQIYYTRGTTIVGNTLTECHPHGICIYHSNPGFTVEGNTVIDPMDTRISIVSGVVVRGTYNQGVVSGNNLIKVKDSTTEPVLNVAKRGIYLASQVGNKIAIGPNNNNFEVPLAGTEDQAVIFGSPITVMGAAIYSGLGSPEGKIVANMGSLYINKTGGAGTTLYVKESTGGNTGWVAK